MTSAKTVKTIASPASTSRTRALSRRATTQETMTNRRILKPPTAKNQKLGPRAFITLYKTRNGGVPTTVPSCSSERGRAAIEERRVLPHVQQMWLGGSAQDSGCVWCDLQVEKPCSSELLPRVIYRHVPNSVCSSRIGQNNECWLLTPWTLCWHAYGLAWLLLSRPRNSPR